LRCSRYVGDSATSTRLRNGPPQLSGRLKTNINAPIHRAFPASELRLIAVSRPFSDQLPSPHIGLEVFGELRHLIPTRFGRDSTALR
jgi:hypothetical protein